MEEVFNFRKKKVNFSQTLFVYHGCDNYCYLDGTRRIVPNNGKRLRPTHYPFWKKTIDVCNKVETRARIKLKARATKNFLNRYIRNVDIFSGNIFSSDDYSDDSLTSDDKPLIHNAPNTEQKLYSDNEREKTTGENLTIDKDTDTTQTNLISDAQNSDNKNETNNETLPSAI